MNETAKSFIEALEKRDMKYLTVTENENYTAVPVGIRLNNTNVEIVSIFDNDNHTVAVRCFGFIKVNEEQFPKALLCCNKLNKEVRWVKFYVDDGDINIDDDALVYGDTAGEEVLELVFRMAGIAEDAYPKINKAIWS